MGTEVAVGKAVGKQWGSAPCSNSSWLLYLYAYPIKSMLDFLMTRRFHLHRNVNEYLSTRFRKKKIAEPTAGEIANNWVSDLREHFMRFSVGGTAH